MTIFFNMSCFNYVVRYFQIFVRKKIPNCRRRGATTRLKRRREAGGRPRRLYFGIWCPHNPQVGVHAKARDRGTIGGRKMNQYAKTASCSEIIRSYLRALLFVNTNKTSDRLNDGSP